MNWFSQETPAILFVVRTAIETVLAILFLGSLLLAVWGFLHFKFSKTTEAKTKAKGLMERGAIGAVITVATWLVAAIIANILGIPSQIPHP